MTNLYDIGIEKLQIIVNQEILLTESYIIIRKRIRNITHIIVSNITKIRKKKGKRKKSKKKGE